MSGNLVTAAVESRSNSLEAIANRRIVRICDFATVVDRRAGISCFGAPSTLGSGDLPIPQVG
jgi:hypothetical protein